MSLSTKYVAFVTFALSSLAPMMAFAQESESRGGAGGPIAAISAGFAIGLAVLGGTLSQGRAAAAALEGISRNPGASSKIQTPMILGLALIESLVLLGFVIAIILTGKI